jgi:XTP/dITP diphosphohydrolase
MQKLVLASGNAGKIREFQAILTGYELIAQSALVKNEVEETGSTFVENAIIKARHAARHCQCPVLADDSGLVVDCLDGEPGIRSARYAGKGASDQDNIEKLLLNMADVPSEERSARFVCVLVLFAYANDPVPLIAQGEWAGKILTHPQGRNGFGYDPVFWVPEMKCASAELAPDVKNVLSHRGKALKQLMQLLTVS